MNSPEFPRNHDQPDREQVPDNELDLTGSVDQPGTLIDVIFKAISAADAADQIPEWGARTMARYLANLLPDTTSALHHFAITGRPEHRILRSELADLREASKSRFTGIVISGAERRTVRSVRRRLPPGWPATCKLNTASK